MTRYPQQASHFYSFIMPDYPSYQRFAVGTERCNTRSKTTTGGLTMKRNTKIALVMMALSAMAMGSTILHLLTADMVCGSKMPRL
ncbi:zinc resistance-associated protein [Escherichia coli]|uniref:Zinc resistance-associated protein n=1 Tax=Escherichia coli TaxID=562 RepID=A0A484Y9C2_ECOLX|nr:zinc resistance-associated protein [Escherichia coli]